MFSKKNRKRKNKCVCYGINPVSGSPFQPHRNIKTVIDGAARVGKVIAKNPVVVTAGTAARAVGQNPLFIAGTSAYVGALAGHIIPEFHQTLCTQGFPAACAYGVGAVWKGHLNPNSYVGQTALFACKSFVKILPEDQHEIVFKEVARGFGSTGLNDLKKAISYKGGGYIQPNYISIYTKVYFSCLFSFFCIVFLKTLNNELNTNVQTQKDFSIFYRNQIVPYGFKTDKTNYLLNSLFILDDLYLLDISDTL